MTDAPPGAVPEAAQGRRFEHIQILRFLGAAAVIGYHVRDGVASYYGVPHSSDYLLIGIYGPDLLFVISGCIISYVAMTRETNPPTFLRKRIERVVPLYWIYTTVFVVAFDGLPHLLPGLVRGEAPISLGHYVRSMLFLGWVEPLQKPVLYVGWTLENEMLLYLMFFAMMLTRRLAIPLTAMAFALLVLIGGWLGPQARTWALFFFVNPMLYDLTLGLIAGQMLVDPRRIWMMAPALAVLPFLPPRPLVVIAAGLVCLALVAAALWLDRRGAPRGRLARAMVRLGDATYTIYLAQALTNSMMLKICTRLIPRQFADLAILLVTALSIAIGYGLYLLVERPLQLYFRRRYRERAIAATEIPAAPA